MQIQNNILYFSDTCIFNHNRVDFCLGGRGRLKIKGRDKMRGLAGTEDNSMP